VVVGSTYVLGYILSSVVFMSRFSRRHLLVMSGFGMALATAAVAAAGAAREAGVIW